MATKIKLKEVYEMQNQYGAVYTGGQIAWSNDGTKLYCQNGHKINVVELDTVSVMHTFGNSAVDEEDLEDQIYTFALSLNGSVLVSVHKSGLLKLWDLMEMKLKKIWKAMHQGPVVQLCFNPTQTLIASGGADSTIRLWDFENQICTGTLKGCQGVLSVMKFLPTKMYIVAAGDNCVINAWNTEKRLLEKQFKSHFSTVTDVAFSEDELYMISAGRDKVLILWNFDECKHIRTIPVYESIESIFLMPTNVQLPNGLKLNDNELYVMVAGEEGVIKVWEMKGSKIMFMQENAMLGSVTHLLFNEFNKQVAVVGVDQNIIIHDLETFNCVKQVVGFTDEILDLLLLGSKDNLIAMATNSNDIKLYDTESMNCKLLRGHTDIVLSLAGSKNILVSSGKDNSVKVWKIDTFEAVCIGSGTRHTNAVGAVDIDSKLEFIVSGSQDKCIKVWKVPDVNLAHNEDPVVLNCFGTQLAHEKDINSVKISPNNRLIATGSQDKTAKIWDALTLQLVNVFRGHRRGIWSVQFSPVDQILLTTAADCTIRLWSLTDTTCLKSLEGHESSVLRAEFITEGMQIISAGADGLLKLWNIKTSECKQSLDKHDSRIWAMAVSNDGNIVYSGGADSQLIKWKDVTVEKKEEEIKKLQEIALEDQQLANLIHQKQMLKALKLALKLDRPLTTLKIINSIIKAQEKGLDVTISDLNDAYKESLLRHSVNWNTNGRNTIPAQLVINILMSDIITGKLKVTGLSKLIEDSLPYTERHFHRMTEYLKDVNLLTYTLKIMQPHMDKEIIKEIKMEEDSD